MTTIERTIWTCENCRCTNAASASAARTAAPPGTDLTDLRSAAPARGRSEG